VIDDGSELGRSLRTWRDRISPAAVGLPANGSRRAVGLRREELASLAGLSVDYVTRLEQGRSTSPSAQVLTALARALRLADAERDYLFRLARQVAPSSGMINARLTPGVQRLLARLEGTPVGVFDAGWTLLAWNSSWAVLMGDASGQHGRDRNVAWRHFTGQRGRVVHSAAQTVEFEAEVVADLRAATARYPRDEELRRLTADLRSVSPRFAELWQAGAVGAHAADRKRVEHPEVGGLTLDCDVLTVQGADLRVIVYTAEPGSPDAEKLRLLQVIGLQAMS
jgi:transcriptional regulator with XRE-family HTH domain